MKIPQVLVKMVFMPALAAILASCGQATEGNPPDTETNHAVEISNPSNTHTKTRQLVVNCPLQVDRYDEVQSEKNYPLTVIGLCPNDGSFPTKLEFITEIPAPLSDFSKFTVIDSEYETTNLTKFFSSRNGTNSFFLLKEKANDMWSGLEKGSYEFSANIISEDYEIAEIYSFQFEIK